MNNEVVISIKNVGINYKRKKSLLKVKKAREFWALNDVTFDVYKGEVLGVLGRNGAGKSTILSILGGILEPDRGSIEINTSSIALLSLQAGFIPFLSGRKNVILNGLLLGLEKKEILTKIPDIIEFSELGDFFDEPVDTYSSGMKTRLGFSAAIHINPQVILIDEVLGVGDASFQKKSSLIMKQKIKDDNVTAIIVSHSEATIRELCTRAVWIDKGKTMAEGEVEEVLNKYKESMNL